DVSLALPIIACAWTAPAAEVAALSLGDVMLPGWSLRRTESGTLAGPVTLAPSSLEHGIGADLTPEGRLVLRGDVDVLSWTPNEAALTEEKMNEPVLQAIGEVPVVVRVEIGSATMRAREWAALGVGDVIALGQRIAEPVILHAGGIEIARGELVEI